MYLLYSLFLAFALVAGLPFWLFQAIRNGKYTHGLGERFGRVPGRLLKTLHQPTIWIHAVSVGEVFAISKLVAHIQEGLPQYRIIVSTTTDTGQRLAREKFGETNVF
ncbi:MAG: 3-deoxy-D-manno-octulosonic acid transferase, partial [Candidatus Angelobacter sp.]